MSEETCKTCNGTGNADSSVRYPVPGGGYYSPCLSKCPDCKGLGTFAKTEYLSLGELHKLTDLSPKFNNSLIERIEKLEKYTSDIIDLYVAADINLANDIIKLGQKIQLLEMNKDNKFSEFVKCWIEKIEKLEKKVNVLDYTKASLDNIQDLLAINMQQQALNASVNNILETLIEKSDAKP